MGRRRWIDTEGLYFDDELVEALGFDGLLIYIRLWGLADDFGGYEAKYKTLARQMGALEITPTQVEKKIGILISLEKIIPYQIDKKSFHWIRAFLRYNREARPRLPSIPTPPWLTVHKKKDKNKTFARFDINKKALTAHLESQTPQDINESGSDTSATRRGHGDDTSATNKERKRKERKLKESEDSDKPNPAPPTDLTDRFQPLVKRLTTRVEINRSQDGNRFPWPWIQKRINQKWDPEIIEDVFSLCVEAAIKYGPIEKMTPYFDTIWAIEAPNQRERQLMAEADRIKEDEKSMEMRLKDLTDKIFKRID